MYFNGTDIFDIYIQKLGLHYAWIEIRIALKILKNIYVFKFESIPHKTYQI